MKIHNIENSAARIKKAVQNKERIIIYADSDPDGVCSAVILKEAIEKIGGKVFDVMFPDREKDGYGINLRALELLKDKTPVLFITLDLGISNVEEIKIANKIGLEVIVVDHHQPLEVLPPAEIIVNPKQKLDKYPFKDLCNGGLTFRLAEEILGENIPDNFKNSLLELAALSTIADMVPQVAENKDIIEKGLASLKKTSRPGLKAFFNILGEREAILGGQFKIISALGAAESIDFKNKSFELLTDPSLKECIILAQELIGKAESKQKIVQQIAWEIERRISKKNEAIIFEGDPSWKLILAGSVASIIAVKYGKPTFIFKKMDEDSAGSVRSLIEGQDSVKAMDACKEYLVTYGGHPKASGFRVKNENLEKFKGCLIKYFENN